MATLEILGHRGARGEAPENTFISFQRASDAGVAGIELDVRMNAEGVLYTFHDKTLTRATSTKGRFHHQSSERLATLDARHPLPWWPQPEPIPTLESVLTGCPSHLHYQLEIKGFMPSFYLDRLVRQLSLLVTKLNMNTRVVVTSEDVNVLRFLKRLAPQLKRGYVCQYRHRMPIGTCQRLGCEWLIAHHGIMSPRLMKKARNAGLKISCWTVNDLDVAERLAVLGVDSLITDYPTAMLAHFQQRNQPLA